MKNTILRELRMSDIDLFEEDAPPLKRCNGCGRYFPENELRRCRACGEVFCKDCQKTHDCRHQQNVHAPLKEETETKIEVTAKERKVGKIILAFAIICIVLYFTCGICGFLGDFDGSTSSQSPSKTFDIYYESLKDGDSEKVWSMLSKEGQADCSEIRINNVLTAKKYYGYIFYGGYEITNEIVSGNTAYLDVTITYENLYGIKYTKDFEVKCVYEDGMWKIAQFDEGM